MMIVKKEKKKNQTFISVTLTKIKIFSLQSAEP